MTVPSQTPRNLSAAAPGATAFPYDFKILDASHLLVQVDGVTKTLNVDYTIDGVGNDAGGTVTFATPLVGGESVLRKRNMPFSRSTDYQHLGDFGSATMNNDQDAPVMMVQQVAADTLLTLRLPEDTTASAALPVPVPNYAWRWSSDGKSVEYFDWTGGWGSPGGSSGIGFIQSGTGAVPRTVQDKGREQPATPEDFGAVGDGATDDMLALQKWLDRAGSLALNGKTYLTGPLFVRSNTKIQFHPDTIIMAKPGFGTNDRLLNIAADSVTIFGCGAALQMVKAEYVSGEQRHCVNASGASNLRIYDLIAKDSGGDGFYLNGSNLSLINCIADNNRRNGLSIVSGQNIHIIGGEYKNTSGTNPQFGIDIEPNNSTDTLYNINLSGVTTSGNARGGISFVPFSTANPVSINVSGCVSIDDGSDAASGSGNGLLFALSPANAIGGSINVTNCTVKTPKSNGVSFVQWTENSPLVRMRNVNVINPGAAATASNSFNCGFIQTSSSDAGVGQGNFELIDCSAIDTRGVPLMRIGCFLQAQHMGQKNIRVENFKQQGQTSGFTTPVVLGAAFTLTNVQVYYKPENVTAVAATETLTRSNWGLTATNGGQTSHTVNLPPATNNEGLEYAFRVTQAGGFLRVIPNAADTILRYGADAGISIVARDVGDYVKIRSLGSNKWAVVEVAGQWNAFISTLPSGAKRISNGFLSAAPASGTWAVGDIVYNTAPAAGGFIGWVCVAAGTPGTWKPFGGISA